MKLKGFIGEKLTLNEFRRYVRSYSFGNLPPDELVVHHTYKPDTQNWKGEESILALKKYYEVVKGWCSAPHLFVAEDGIWLFVPMYNVGIHAGKGNATYVLEHKEGDIEFKGFCPPLQRSGDYKLKSYSVGIEVVGNYDNKTWAGETKKNAFGVIKILREVLNIPDEKITLHRDYCINRNGQYTKSCPGFAITKKYLIDELSVKDKVEADEDFEQDETFKGLPEWSIKSCMEMKELGLITKDFDEGIKAYRLAVILDQYNDIIQKQIKNSKNFSR